VLDGAHRVEHQADLLGRETARALPGGGWLQSAYDALGRVQRRRAGRANVAEPWGRAGEPEWVGTRPERLTVDMAYRYDVDGELAESWDQARGRTQYAYDPIGQLLAMVPEKARSELFRYDPAGNLYESGEGAEERVYGPGNRLLRKGDTEYEWDADGRLREKRRRDATSGREEVWRYAWNGAGLLRQVERPDGLRAEFAYDPFARRVQKRVTRAGVRLGQREFVSETRFVWDGDVLVHEIEKRAQEGGDPVVEERTYWFEEDGFAPVAHRERRVDDVGRESGGWFHYVNDPIGTPERLVAGDGSVACELRRTAWGETEVVGGKASTRVRFQGQYEDEETGLRYNRFRYYDAEAGRFVSSDPIGLRGGAHAYRYAATPTTWVDPFGLANYTPQSHAHVVSHGHDASGPVIPGKSRFCAGEGAQAFTDEIINHPSVAVTHQPNGRIKYKVADLGRTTGTGQSGANVRGGTVIVQGPSSPPGMHTTYAPDEVVTQFPT
jgi:RHS repeat-associated protein